MDTLKLNKETAIELFRDENTPDSLKKILIDTFGKKVLIGDVMDRVKTFYDACKELDINPLMILKDTDTPDEAAYKKLKTIIQVLNEGWTPDWSNSNEQKYYPWFEFTQSSEFGLSFSDYDCTRTASSVGSSLCFRTKELAKYAGTQFIEIYREFLT